MQCLAAPPDLNHMNVLGSTLKKICLLSGSCAWKHKATDLKSPTSMETIAAALGKPRSQKSSAVYVVCLEAPPIETHTCAWKHFKKLLFVVQARCLEAPIAKFQKHLTAMPLAVSGVAAFVAVF